MINLIPVRAKKKLVLEYWTRVISVWLSLWALSLLVGAVILLPAFVLISSQVETYTTSADEASEKVAVYNNVSVELVRSSEQARTAIDQFSSTPFSNYVSFIERLEGTDINLTEIEISQASEVGMDPIQLSGVAIDRVSLASFRDRLLAEEAVKEVDLPISNLAQDKNIQFSISITLNDTSKI